MSFGTGPIRRLLFWIAVAFPVFQILTAAHLVDLSSQITRALHVGFLTLLAFPLIAYGRRVSVPLRSLAWAFALAGVAVALFQWWQYQPLVLRAGRPLPPDIVVGVIALTALLILGGSAVLNLPRGALRTVFWMCLGLVAAGSLQFSASTC